MTIKVKGFHGGLGATHFKETVDNRNVCTLCTQLFMAADPLRDPDFWRL